METSVSPCDVLYFTAKGAKDAMAKGRRGCGFAVEKSVLAKG
jgi:hypothetical protein